MMKITNEMHRFLIVTVFGYDLQAVDVDYKMLKVACFRRAYLDLARVVPYKYSVSEIDEYRKKKNEVQKIESFKSLKKNFFSEVENLIIDNKNVSKSREVIASVFSCAGKYYDKVFKRPFTYGMAQKWVNMYFKYLWLFANGEESYIEDLGIPTDLDMPIDSYIIDALFDEEILSEETCNDIDSPLYDLIITKDKKINQKKRASDSILKWSGWDEAIYLKVQGLIKGKCSSINMYILAYENDLWLNHVIKGK